MLQRSSCCIRGRRKLCRRMIAVASYYWRRVPPPYEASALRRRRRYSMAVRNEPGCNRRGENQRSGPRRLALLMMVAGATLTCVVSGCKPKVNAFAPPPPPEVTVAHPVRRSVTRYLESTGTTEAFQSVDLRARVAGFLEQVLFKPGGRRHEGGAVVRDRQADVPGDGEPGAGAGSGGRGGVQGGGIGGEDRGGAGVAAGRERDRQDHEGGEAGFGAGGGGGLQGGAAERAARPGVLRRVCADRRADHQELRRRGQPGRGGGAADRAGDGGQRAPDLCVRGRQRERRDGGAARPDGP